MMHDVYINRMLYVPIVMKINIPIIGCPLNPIQLPLVCGFVLHIDEG